MACPPKGLSVHGDNTSYNLIIMSLGTSALYYIPYIQCMQRASCQERTGSGIWSVRTEDIVTRYMGWQAKLDSMQTSRQCLLLEADTSGKHWHFSLWKRVIVSEVYKIQWNKQYFSGSCKSNSAFIHWLTALLTWHCLFDNDFKMFSSWLLDVPVLWL